MCVRSVIVDPEFLVTFFDERDFSVYRLGGKSRFIDLLRKG
jgi:hypothetical protein